MGLGGGDRRASALPFPALLFQVSLFSPHLPMDRPSSGGAREWWCKGVRVGWGGRG